VSLVEFVDFAGTTRLVGFLRQGVGSTMTWEGVWNPATPYVPAQVVLAPRQGGGYFLAVCVAPNVNVNPVTDSGGPAGLGPHWFMEY
jgi:hypothetical protein